ncbi:MAG: hypothetical protein ACUVWN_05975 [bacterium]
MKVRGSLVFLIILSANIFLINSSYAKIDPKTFIGIWLFDDGKGNITQDTKYTDVFDF